MGLGWVSHRCKQDEARPGEWQGERQKFRVTQERQRQRSPGKKEMYANMCQRREGGQRMRDTDRQRLRGEGLAGQKAGERHCSTEIEKRRKGERDKNREKERKGQKGTHRKEAGGTPTEAFPSRTKVLNQINNIPMQCLNPIGTLQP